MSEFKGVLNADQADDADHADQQISIDRSVLIRGHPLDPRSILCKGPVRY